MQLHRLHVKVGPRVGGAAGGGVGAAEEGVLLPRPHLLSSALRAGNRTIAQDAELPLHLQHSSQLGLDVIWRHLDISSQTSKQKDYLCNSVIVILSFDSR